MPLRSFVVVALLSAILGAQGPPPPPPPALPLGAVPAPPENPITEAKRVLGKILFWDEQMSTSDTVACGTCHRPQQGGTDPRLAVHPGLNGIIDPANVPNDDVRGSPGVQLSDSGNNFVPATFFGFNAQVTRRRAPSFETAAFNPETFWDGRAGSTFVDPDTGLVAIASGGALEVQALKPLLADAEMAHTGRTFAQAVQKIAASKPLKLATNIPPDMANALAVNATYPALFAAAFGDGAVTAARIAFAIATYERTLFPNQTAYDNLAAGVPNALTPNQNLGRAFFHSVGKCNSCHAEPTFSDNSFRNLGLRPIAEDSGRQEATNDIADRGKFKVPSLRNVALRPRFFHNGLGIPLNGVVAFYDNEGGPFLDNKDPLLTGLQLTPFEIDRITDYLVALTDPRAQTGQFPFNRPTLRSEVAPPNSNRYAVATPGSGGVLPVMQSTAPSYLGNPDFRIGLSGALGGSVAILGVSALSQVPSLNSNGVLLHINPNAVITTFSVNVDGAGPGGGFATIHTPLPSDPGLAGLPFFVEWFIADPAALGGISETQGASYTLF